MANEAILCGTPIIASDQTTSGRELVGPTGAGLVRELRVDDWVCDIQRLLDDRDRWERIQNHHAKAAEWFALQHSTTAFLGALSAALDRPSYGVASETPDTPVTA